MKDAFDGFIMFGCTSVKLVARTCHSTRRRCHNHRADARVDKGNTIEQEYIV